MQRTGKYFHLHALVTLSMSVEKKCFSAWDLISAGSSHVGSPFTNEEQKNIVCDVIDASVTHACLVYDISHIDC